MMLEQTSFLGGFYRPKILIVDDQPEVRRLVEMTLSVGDYQVLQA